MCTGEKTLRVFYGYRMFLAPLPGKSIRSVPPKIIVVASSSICRTAPEVIDNEKSVGISFP